MSNHTRKAKGNIRKVNNEEESAEKTIEKTKENEINNNLCDISRTKFIELQRNDVTINKLENANKYITEDDIEYRLKFNKNEEIYIQTIGYTKSVKKTCYGTST